MNPINQDINWDRGMDIKGAKELGLRSLEICKGLGATYTDIRVIHTLGQSIVTKNRRIGSIHQAENIGFGIRVTVDGCWGFASSSELNKGAIDDVSKRAVQIARSSAQIKKAMVKLAPSERYIAKWSTPYLIDPFNTSLDEKIAVLLEVEEILSSVKGVKITTASMDFQKRHQLFLSSEGSVIEQLILWSGAGYSATAVDGGETQTRSYPASFGGQHSSAGYELIPSLKLKENAQRIAEEAVALLTADPCPSDEKDLILGSSQLALQIHESCGHPVELDRVLGSEANFAGTSFLTLEKLNKFQYGSPLVNIFADSISPGGLGTFGYDDEGIPAQRWDIVREGKFVGYLTSRETAQVIGLEGSQGAMRADGYNRIPLIRMVNISLKPDKGSLEELISDTEDGIFMDTNRCWSIDQQRLNFQFGCEIGWEIKKGRRVKLLKNPTYWGITPEFWGSCDAICGQGEWILWGVLNCAKGEPGQLIGVGHGTAPARFRGIKVGVGYAR